MEYRADKRGNRRTGADTAEVCRHVIYIYIHVLVITVYLDTIYESMFFFCIPFGHTTTTSTTTAAVSQFAYMHVAVKTCALLKEFRQIFVVILKACCGFFFCFTSDG